MKVIRAQDAPQGGGENIHGEVGCWWKAKRGHPSSSSFDRILTSKGKRCPLPLGHAEPCRLPTPGEKVKSAGRCLEYLPYASGAQRAYIYELIADIQCLNPAYFTERGRPVNSKAIKDGIDREPESRRWLELEMGLQIPEVGVCFDDELQFCCSPDGMVGLQLSDEPTGEINGVPFYDGTCDYTVELKNPTGPVHVRYLAEPDALLNDYRQQAHGHLIICEPKYGGLAFSYCPPHNGASRPYSADKYTDTLRQAMADFWRDFVAERGRLIGQPQGATT